jgi:flagellar biosynthesis component FlhA
MRITGDRIARGVFLAIACSAIASLLLIAVLPGLPMFPVLAVGGSMIYAAWRQGQAPAAPPATEPADAAPRRDEEAPIADVLRVS